MTVGFPAALPPPLSSLRRGEKEEMEEEREREGRGYGMDGGDGKEAIEIAIMSVNGSGWPPAPPLFNNPIITRPLWSERGIPPPPLPQPGAECRLPVSAEILHGNSREDGRVLLSRWVIQGAHATSLRAHAQTHTRTYIHAHDCQDFYIFFFLTLTLYE